GEILRNRGSPRGCWLRRRSTGRTGKSQSAPAVRQDRQRTDGLRYLLSGSSRESTEREGFTAQSQGGGRFLKNGNLRDACVNGLHNQRIEVARRDIRLGGILLDRAGRNDAKEIAGSARGGAGRRFDRLHEPQKLRNECVHR